LIDQHNEIMLPKFATSSVTVTSVTATFTVTVTSTVTADVRYSCVPSQSIPVYIFKLRTALSLSDMTFFNIPHHQTITQSHRDTIYDHLFLCDWLGLSGSCSIAVTSYQIKCPFVLQPGQLLSAPHATSWTVVTGGDELQKTTLTVSILKLLSIVRA
jgi:type IV secretory pathway protease TraF